MEEDCGAVLPWSLPLPSFFPVFASLGEGGVLAQTELLAPPGSLGFAHLSLYHQADNRNLRQGSKGRVAFSSLCCLGFQLLSPGIAEGRPFNLGDKCDNLVFLLVAKLVAGKCQSALLSLGVET